MQLIDLIKTYPKKEKIKHDNIIWQYKNVQQRLYWNKRHKRT